jgi:hypothetical protein
MGLKKRFVYKKQRKKWNPIDRRFRINPLTWLIFLVIDLLLYFAHFFFLFVCTCVFKTLTQYQPIARDVSCRLFWWDMMLVLAGIRSKVKIDFLFNISCFLFPISHLNWKTFQIFIIQKKERTGIEWEFLSTQFCVTQCCWGELGAQLWTEQRKQFPCLCRLCRSGKKCIYSHLVSTIHCGGIYVLLSLENWELSSWMKNNSLLPYKSLFCINSFSFLHSQYRDVRLSQLFSRRKRSTQNFFLNCISCPNIYNLMAFSWVKISTLLEASIKL